MPKYLLLYKGDATAPADMDEAAVNDEMQKWMAWGGRVGDQMVDFGAPCGASCSVVDDGTERDAINITGYTLVQADDLEGAKALCDGHPFLSDGEGNFSIEVFELIDMGG